MKAIKITVENKAAIESALASVNGRADAHTYTSYDDIDGIVKRAEQKSHALLGSRKSMIGAVVIATSGVAVTNAYAKKAFKRVATRIVIEYRSTGWFLKDVVKCDIYQEGGDERMFLSEEQRYVAVKKFTSQFNVRLSAVSHDEV